MKVTALVSVEYPCPRCGGPLPQMRTVPVLPDGRLDMAHDFGPLHKKQCVKCSNAEVKAANRAARKRKKVLAGKPRLVN